MTENEYAAHLAAADRINADIEKLEKAKSALVAEWATHHYAVKDEDKRRKLRAEILAEMAQSAPVMES